MSLLLTLKCVDRPETNISGEMKKTCSSCEEFNEKERWCELFENFANGTDEKCEFYSEEPEKD
jgi:hypothetical protein